MLNIYLNENLFILCFKYSIRMEQIKEQANTVKNMMAAL